LDPARDCRQKFVILISDGSDTYECNGNGQEGQDDQYTRRRATVKRAKELADRGYRVFVIGFGVTMPHFLRNNLNWMAYWGGTDNPGTPNVGSTSAYNPDTFSELCPTSTDLEEHNIEGDGPHWRALTNDPGEIPLSGYAFLAANSTDLTTALKYAIDVVREATYSFSQASVSSSRLMDENYLYEGSFQPLDHDPFWIGHLKKFAINTDGTVGGLIWDAGDKLKNQSADSRNMFTLIGGTRTDFSTSLSVSTFGVATAAERDRVVGYFRGESEDNPDEWKLGDVFRATPINIGTPSPYWFDIRDTLNAFATFRESHVRSTANGLRMVVTGANDGQFHAFRTSDGTEAWSFLPPNLLTKLKNVAHSAHPTALQHQFFVDGSVTVADVWLGSGAGTAKSAGDWKTMLVLSEGRGAGTLLWSGSQHCDSSCAATFNASTSPYYCGYWAFNVTDSTVPVYMWHLNPASAQAPYLGEPYSRFYVGRVKVHNEEKWVGFIGGGYNGDDCAGGGSCDTRGKGFFVVDLQTGNILWSYTMGENASMVYSLAASPAIADTDNDNFIDTAYIGDLGGNVWRMKFCLAANDASCSYENWQGTRLFDSSTGSIRPIYTTPAVTLDKRGKIWVYFGTGDKMDPTAANAQEKFHAVKDYDRTTTYTLSNLENITTGTYTDSDNKRGWYMNLAGSGEKILADPAVFGNVAYFTTYFPPSGADPCSQSGTANLYGVNYVSGGGVMGGGSRSMSIGVGLPTAPVLSFKPGGGSADLYVTVSSSGAGRVPFEPPTLANRNNILYWRDTRLQ
jgi:type IV pilus assembly protein PilY1